ncbi:phasin family protein [Noviherbaspirillum autotrophicum]|uniref:Poly granule associated protein n=1 Tax=Noviherbaspirillum autotrophicum TaxID=709839 RepID=A0A0C1Y8E0_9BURK|nr:phasin family protein [Noviherbaspirillum autotrophicum]KIF83193.1 hypothetical protein TSA66_23920 [Noviherbaspirillum autotrophicum]
MTRKLHDMQQPHEMQLKDAVRNSAQHIWQAGLGAFTTVREEGSELLARLMKEGASLQTRTQQLAGQKISDAITRMGETIGRQTTAPLVKMEEVFEERFTRTLRNFGVPTQDDLKALTDEIEDLHKTVKALSGAGAHARKAPAKGKEKAGAKTGARAASGARNSPMLKKQARVAAARA